MAAAIPDIMLSAVSDLSKIIEDTIHDKLKKIILYGSFSRGDYSSESDVDILILTDLPEQEFNELDCRLDDISAELSLKYGLVIIPLLKNISPFLSYSNVLPFYNNIVKEGIVMYG